MIELLVVIVILGILATIVVFAVRTTSQEAAQASCASDLKTMAEATLAYKAQMGNFPEGLGGPGPQTDTDSTMIDAASSASGPGSELLTGSEVGATSEDADGTITPNLDAPTNSGGWVKDVPSSSNHYFIWVTNNGTGDIFVGSGTLTSTSTQPTATNCNGIS